MKVSDEPPRLGLVRQLSYSMDRHVKSPFLWANTFFFGQALEGKGAADSSKKQETGGR